LVIATRWWKGQPVFTDRDWRFLFGHPREKVFTGRLWLRFVTPYGLWWFAGAMVLAVIAILLIVPKWLR
jgi:hypothetical protein